MATKRKPFEPKADAVINSNTDLSGVEEAESIERVLTVNGKPIPVEFAHLINFAMTDQGQAEARANDVKNGMKSSGARVTGDAWDKTLQRKTEAQVWDGFDPLKEAVDAVREPGMEYRFLSDRVTKRRGRRGWEAASDADGKPVVVAGMTLGKMSTEAAQKRNSHYQEVGNEMLRDAAERYEEGQTKLIREAKVKGLAPLRAGDTLTDSHAHPGMVTPVGFTSSRGLDGDQAA